MSVHPGPQMSSFGGGGGVSMLEGNGKGRANRSKQNLVSDMGACMSVAASSVNSVSGMLHPNSGTGSKGSGMSGSMFDTMMSSRFELEMMSSSSSGGIPHAGRGFPPGWGLMAGGAEYHQTYGGRSTCGGGISNGGGIPNGGGGGNFVVTTSGFHHQTQ